MGRINIIIFEALVGFFIISSTAPAFAVVNWNFDQTETPVTYFVEHGAKITIIDDTPLTSIINYNNHVFLH
jgi:hypothetical protein